MNIQTKAKYIEIEKNVFEKIPNYFLGVIYVKNINNCVSSPFINNLFKNSITNFLNKYSSLNLKEENDFILYRDSFFSLDINPNKFMPSIEALGRRIQKTRELPNINPIVDLANALSLKYVLPVGAHDIKNNVEPTKIRFSKLNDTFKAIGSSNYENLSFGELIYVCENTVKTRRWLWRQSDDSKIEKNSNEILFFIDGFKESENKVIEATEELSTHLKSIFSCEPIKIFLDKNNNFF